MESRAKILGHPVHPMLIVLPLGLFIMSVVMDIVYLTTKQVDFSAVAYWNIAVGILGGALAAVFGWVDWFSIPRGTRAKAIGLWHGGGNAIVLLLFALSWLLRRGEQNHVPTTAAFVLAVIGVGLGAVTGWLGGELVDRLGIGVDEGAHADAPNSLSRRPATERA
jgi:uncharacterized membrane protein